VADGGARAAGLPLFDGAGFEAGAYYFLCRTSLWDTSKIVQFREWLIQEAGGKIQVDRSSSIREAPSKHAA
jgi:hypothetical protein